MAKRGEIVQLQVMRVLRSRDEPVSAYDILDALRAETPKIAPPTVYRALNALMDKGQVHRLESLNAYVACKCDGHQQAAVLSICDDCGTVEESVSSDVLQAVSRVAGQSGFAPLRHIIEVHGRCAACGTGSVSA